MREAERFDYDEVDDSSVFELFFFIYKPRIMVLL